ncbi:hypothetical protein LTR41_001120 [Exophiala xenobiotica]|nr:hypothetical protein LTR41_001120 [Exophiala xenobiotica]KAK5324273.1 hypothetical protein LTR93_005061 [Exophiala xenobiotica]KAK5410927.1 hypothetical protein LTR06_005816 [Exophiala xenobiotica]KAK5442077.1 hypothetical protein LTR18_005929 [Exophiala xenobiotica]
MDTKFSAGDYVPQRARDRRKFAIWPRIVITSLIFGLCLHSIDKFISRLLPERHRAGRDFAQELAQSPFRWGNIEPSKELQYHDCYDGLQCARLDVPMDYHAPEDSPDRVALAIIRLPAKVPVSDPRYGGAILINPGGPGGSGVAKLLHHGSQMQYIVDSDKPVHRPTEEEEEEDDDDDKYFDIIGFDPRGVNHSTPILTCFPDGFARQTWNLQSLAEGLLGSSEGSLRTGWRRARAFSMGCSSRLDSENGTTNFLEHVNTTPATADMVEIIERHGQWREREGQRAVEAAYNNQLSRCNLHSIAQRTKWQKGREPLLYWGFSYGTVLGSTFAAMYPERVSRMVLDGVVDAEDYYNGPWLGNLQDTDNILHNMMRYCSEAGPDNCRLWRPGGAPAVLAAYEKLLHDIWDDPLSVVGDQRRGPEIITWTDVKMVVKDALYQPIILGPIMVELLQDIINGTGSVFASYKQSGRTPSCRSEQCEIDGPYSEECVSPGWNELEATSAILCTDAQDIGSFTEDEFRGYWRMLQTQSKAMGDYWAQTRLGCASWQARAKWRFAGPVAAANGTSHPILWVSNTLDTVTPLRNAKRMNERFNGSVLLQQDCEGHCSFAAPSLCTAKAVKRYFQTGEMPQPGTLCETDAKPFEARRLLSEKMAALSTHDAELLNVLQQLAESQSSNRFL